ncbi:FAD dependent oxidoreductase-domain-containing protein [Xylaria bambusicola]|uniref:FAD dependent oxidoreductase-domain-containing protein n=1 Tax=Xylaria bambusicola TaxID=326684 RepID=UPI002008BFFC|nr:FAD dependent oxidoreductase-domain-containing protein [Xylaria bambusicola]KAI0514894.1 FAD dependent oxidoreductase-domain-containing protein [Xylaria bambusicola]
MAFPGAGGHPTNLNTNATPNAQENEKENKFRAPKSILIIGSGVFGLSTAFALTRRSEIPSDTPITVIDRSPDPDVFPARDASSIDSSRIIRADYADVAYAELAAEAQEHWRRDIDKPDSLGGDGRYNESGLLLAAENGADGATVRADGHPTGLGYTRRSWVNALALAHAEGRSLDTVRLLPSGFGIAKLSRTDREWADWGYLNTAAGWADAERSMRWLYDRVVATQRVTFVNGTVETLETQTQGVEQHVTGARLTDGRNFSADLVIVATGAWTPTLVGLAGSAVATGQCVAYLRITDDEQARLAEMPVCLNLTDGCFVIPPRNNVLKIARHSYGPVPNAPLKPCRSATGENSQVDKSNPKPVISQPRTHLTDPSLNIPAEGAADLRRALRRMIPWLGDRPFFETRLCWYTDTPTGDWIVDYHPSYKNLFVATGGSGHAFKFLPILGEKVVDCLLGRHPKKFREKWMWKGGVGGAVKRNDGLSSEQEMLQDELAVELSVATEDGTRGGKPGLILVEEMVEDEKPHILSKI